MPRSTRVAALDLGTNTFLCLIAEVDPSSGQVLKIIADETTTVRLGQGVDASGQLHPEALARARDCLQKYRSLVDSHRVDVVGAVATSAARDASNREEFFALLRDLQIPVQLLSGEEEARVTFSGAISGFDSAFPESLGSRSAVGLTFLDGSVVIDVGGGSTEVVQGVLSPEGWLTEGHSFQLGSVRLYEQLGLQPPIQTERIPVALEHCRALLTQGPLPSKPISHVFAVAGTPTTLASMELGGVFDPARIDGYRMSQRDLMAWAQRLAVTSVDSLMERYKVDRRRADVLLAGTLVLLATLQTLGQMELRVSTRGVRYGLAQILSRKKGSA